MILSSKADYQSKQKSNDRNAGWKSLGRQLDNLIKNILMFLFWTENLWLAGKDSIFLAELTGTFDDNGSDNILYLVSGLIPLLSKHNI